MAARPLTPKQQRFVEEYLLDLNATGAYRRAGYKAQGRAAENNASRLLGNAGVKAAIAEAQAARSERVKVEADDILRELKIIGHSSVWDYQIDDLGNVTLAPGVSPEAIRAVSSLKKKIRHIGPERVEYETEIKLWPKVQAQEMLGKHIGLFPNKVEVENTGTLRIKKVIVHAAEQPGPGSDRPAS